MRKLISKYRTLSLPIKASFWFVICNFLQKATQIITTPIYTRIMNSTQYGEYIVFLSWVEIAAIFATLDIFYSGFNVGMEKFKEDRVRYTASMHGLCIAITSGWGIWIFFAPNFWSGILGISNNHLFLLMVYMYIFPVYQFWSAQKKYTYRYQSLLIITFFMSLATILTGTGFALNTNDKSTSVIFAKVIVEGLIAIPLLAVGVRKIRYLFNIFYWKYALKFNIPLIPHYLSTMVLNQSDRIMILNMSGASAAGIYSVAYSTAAIITIVQNAVNSAITPWLYKKLRDKDYSMIASVTTSIIAVLAVANILLIIIAPEVIAILSTQEYYDAIWIIPPVSFGVFLTAVYGLFVNVEFFYGSNKLAAFASLSAALLNVVLNFFFIRRFGYLAAGYTTLIGYLFLTIVHYIGIRKVCKRFAITVPIFDEKKLLVIGLLFALLTCIISICYRSVVIRY